MEKREADGTELYGISQQVPAHSLASSARENLGRDGAWRCGQWIRVLCSVCVGLSLLVNQPLRPDAVQRRAGSGPRLPHLRGRLSPASVHGVYMRKALPLDSIGMSYLSGAGAEARGRVSRMTPLLSFFPVTCSQAQAQVSCRVFLAVRLPQLLGRWQGSFWDEGLSKRSESGAGLCLLSTCPEFRPPETPRLPSQAPSGMWGLEGCPHTPTPALEGSFSSLCRLPSLPLTGPALPHPLKHAVSKGPRTHSNQC